VSETERAENHLGEGPLVFLLLLLLFGGVTGSIAAAEWTDGLHILTWASFGGLGWGGALAKLRRVRGALAHLTALALAPLVTFLLVASLLSAKLTLEEKWVVIQDRAVRWFSQVAAGGSSSDNLIFVIQLTLVTWWLAYVAAWFVYRRHQVWGALLPSGGALLLNLFYAPPQADLYVGVYLLSALLLLARLNLLTLERGWRAAAIGYTSDVQLDVMGYGALFAFVLLCVVWVLPARAPGPTWLALLDPLQEPWQAIEAQFTRAFSAVRAVARPAPTTFWGATLTLGGPIHLGQRPVMDVRAQNGRYWRAMVYDRYSGSGWFSTHLDLLTLNANDTRLDVWGGYLRADVTQTIKLYLNHQNILYAQAQPLRFNIPIEARVASDFDATPPILDVTVVRARRPLREGDTYVVVSALSVADEDALRADSTEYPAWIRAHYTQLPDELPARVRAKARQVAAAFSNPYDRAVALEKFVRAHIRYDEQVSAPPLEVDGVDYVLFERPAGYCNYYASAMAVLARALDIPARVVSGYALGEFQDGVFHIVEANAHAWVEIYFPSYGWIEFEPTATKPEIERPKKSAAPENPETSEAAAEQRRRRERNRADEMDEEDAGRSSGAAPAFWSEQRGTALAFVGVVFIVFGALGIRRWNRMRRLARLAPAARVYEEMLDRARWLGVREERGATPFERARVIGRVLPHAHGETERIAALYTRERFGARQLDAVERATLTRAWETWRAAWWRGMGRQIMNRISVPARNLKSKIINHKSKRG